MTRSWYLETALDLGSLRVDWIATGWGCRKVSVSGGVLYHALFSEHARPPPMVPRSAASVRTARSGTWPGARAGLLTLLALTAGCGSSPGRPTPSPSPSASAVQPGGPVAG